MNPSTRCVLLANRHHRFAESVRDMLQSEFEAVFVVATVNSLTEGVMRLRPQVVIVDQSLAEGHLPDLIGRIRSGPTQAAVLILTSGNDPCAAQHALEAGADGVVLRSAIADDLFAAIESVGAGRPFVSPRIGETAPDEPGPRVR